MQRFHVSSTGQSLNYLPLYLGLERGYFADAGLEVTISVPEPWSLVLDDLASGRAQAVLGGIWVPAMFYGRGRPMRAFAQLCNRVPLALISRPGSPPFCLQNLPGKQVAMSGGNGPSLGLYFKMTLREQGIAPESLRFIHDLDTALLVPCFLGGLADYLLIDLPTAEALAARGLARVECSYVAEGGDLPWSVFYTEGDARGQEAEARFTAALSRAISDVRAEPAESYAALLQRNFPNRSREALISLTERYRALNMWSSVKIEPAGFGRWQKGLQDAGYIAAPVPFEALVEHGA